MANKFSAISKKFYNEYRNGVLFNLNLTEFKEELQGNEGEVVKLVEVVEVGVIVNESQAIEMTFSQLAFGSVCKFTAPLLDFVQEGMYAGAGVQIEFDGNTITTASVDVISGSGNVDLFIDGTGRTALLAAGLVDGEVRDDIVIKITDVPDYLNYKYGLNPNTSAIPNYINKLGYEQSYQLKVISGSLQSMLWVGSKIGGDYGAIQLKFNTTLEQYKHQFQVEHIFKIPDYKEGEILNLDNLVNPLDLDSSNSLKYGNGFFFGGVINNPVMVFEDLGSDGNVGYKNENFNGFVNNYGIENVVITNSLATGTLEGTTTNALTFDIKNNLGNWAGGEEVIFTHKKLPTALEYTDQNTALNTIWVWENIRNTEGSAPVSGSILSAFELNIDGSDSTLINVECTLTYSAGQQLLLSDIVAYLLTLTVATQNLSNADTMDRVDLVVERALYSNNTDVLGLLLKWKPEIYENWEYDTGSKTFTNNDGYDGDFFGADLSFESDVTRNAIIKSLKVHFASDLGTGNDWFPLFTQPIALGKISTVPVTSGGNTYNYQVQNKDYQNAFNLPSTEQLNRIELVGTIPATATGVQPWLLKLAMRTPWRDWIENLNVPALFIDYTEPQDGQNTKSSNYSNVSSYDTKVIVEVLVGNDLADTTYLLETDISTILDFDDAGGNSFSATTFLYDENGDVTDNIYTNQNTRIEIEFSHTLGTLAVGNIWGRVWIEANNTTLQPWDLSTDKDFTNSNNLLQPTDTLATSNTQFVEIVSVSNKVTLICQTNKLNLTNNTVYNVYGRLGNKL